MTLRAAFAAQGQACTRLGSPFMGRLMALCAAHWPEDTAIAEKFAAFSGDIGPGGASLPLRLAGGLHALVLSGRDPGLAAVYPPATADDVALWREVRRALEAHAAFLDTWCDSPPQTNELRRSAVLIAAGHALTARFAKPLRLSELGASAGLNLMWDRYALSLGAAQFGNPGSGVVLVPDWQGPLPPNAPVDIAERRGVDLRPPDPGLPEDQLRLLAYLWPDQPDRIARTRAAFGLHAATVDRGDAIDWLEARLSNHLPGVLHLVYHTIAWQYFPPEGQARGRRLIEAAGTRATGETPLAWLGMEQDGGSDGAGLSLRLWPGDTRHVLGRADFHGRWVQWRGLGRASPGG